MGRGVKVWDRLSVKYDRCGYKNTLWDQLEERLLK